MATYVVRDAGGKVVVGPSEILKRLNARLPMVLREMSVTLLTLIQQGIQREQSPDGTPWESLKPATVKQRGSAHPILRRRGYLYRSLTPGTTANSAFVGTNWPYAAAHQFGARIKRTGGTATLYFRQDKRGRVGNRFVKRRLSNVTRQAHVGPYEIVIPARAFLFTEAGRVPAPWQERCRNIVLRHLEASR